MKEVLLYNDVNETTVVHSKRNDYSLYIGRGSKWGNPFIMKSESDRARVIKDYKAHIMKRPDLLMSLPELKGHRLGCFCAPKACHGDVLIELLANSTFDGPITLFKGIYSFLSNFYNLERPLVYQEIAYRTIEHFYMAMKTTDLNERRKISEIWSPAEAKKYGSKVKLRPDWEDVKGKVMESALKYKFDPKVNPRLHRALSLTAGRELMHGNYHNDTYWGKCLKTDVGEDILGKLLMDIRGLAC